MVKGEIYYLIGKPNHLKHELLNSLTHLSESYASCTVFQTFTTSDVIAKDGHFEYLDEVDFKLRQSMDMFSLYWEKNGMFYGISGEVSEYLNKGINVVINGSLHNVEQASKLFPQMNVIMVKKQKPSSELAMEGYPLIIDEDVQLEWVNNVNGIYCPYVLTLLEDNAQEKAAELLIKLIEYNESYLDKVI